MSQEPLHGILPCKCSSSRHSSYPFHLAHYDSIAQYWANFTCCSMASFLMHNSQKKLCKAHLVTVKPFLPSPATPHTHLVHVVFSLNLLLQLRSDPSQCWCSQTNSLCSASCLSSSCICSTASTAFHLLCLATSALLFTCLLSC